MRLLKIAAAALLIASTTMLVASEKWPQEPKTFRRVPFGVTADGVKLLEPVRCMHTDDGQLLCGEDVKLGNVDTTVVFMFDKTSGFFDSASLSFKSDDYQFIRSAFIEKYGPPHKILKTKVSNLMGVEVPTETLSWSGDTVHVQLNEHSGTMTDGAAYVTLLSSEKQAEDDAESQKKKAASKL